MVKMRIFSPHNSLSKISLKLVMIRLGLSEGNFCYSLYETLISNSFCVFKRLQKLQKCYDFLCTISISKYIQEISSFLGSNIIQRFLLHAVSLVTLSIHSAKFNSWCLSKVTLNFSIQKAINCSCGTTVCDSTW